MVRAKAGDTTPTGGKEDIPQGYYLFNDEQSMEIEKLRMAMRGVAELIYDELRPEMENEPLPARPLVWAILDQFEKRMGEIIGPERVAYAWIDPAEVKGALQ